ncbi:MAG: hypothetical protein ACRDJC_01895 [Thermomicrobiales bacterium]
MDRHASMDQRALAARREATWNMIASGSFLAPAWIAIDEARERTLAEAAQSRLLAGETRSARHAGMDTGRWVLPAWVVALGQWITRPQIVDAVADWRRVEQCGGVREFEPAAASLIPNPAPCRAAPSATSNDRHHVARTHLWRHLAGCAATPLTPPVLTNKP